MQFTQELQSNLKQKVAFRACCSPHQANVTTPSLQAQLSVITEHMPHHPACAANRRNLEMHEMPPGSSVLSFGKDNPKACPGIKSSSSK